MKIAFLFIIILSFFSFQDTSNASTLQAQKGQTIAANNSSSSIRTDMPTNEIDEIKKILDEYNKNTSILIVSIMAVLQILKIVIDKLVCNALDAKKQKRIDSQKIFTERRIAQFEITFTKLNELRKLLITHPSDQNIPNLASEILPSSGEALLYLDKSDTKKIHSAYDYIIKSHTNNTFSPQTFSKLLEELRSCVKQ